jgi:hypothetical protein
MTASFWRGISYIRERIIPHNPKSDKQVAIRGVLTDGVSKWRFGAISAANKARWNSYAQGQEYSGFNRFMEKYIEANYDAAAGTKVSPQVIPDPQ